MGKLKGKIKWETKNFRSLMRWFRLICISLVIFDLTTTVFFSVTAMKATSLDTIERTESQISEYIHSVWNLGNAIAAAPATCDDSLSLQERAQMLIPYANAYDLFMLGITNREGLLAHTLDRSLITSESMLKNGGIGDISSHPAFQEAMATGKSILTDTYPAGADSSTMIYTIWIPYYIQEQIAGAITVSIKFAFINNIISSTSLQDNYYFTLLDSKNKISANPDAAMVGMAIAKAYEQSKWVSVPLETLESNLNEGRSGGYWGINHNRLEYVTYMSVEGTPWNLIMRTDFFGSFKSTFISLAIKLAAYLSLIALFSLRNSKEIISRERLFNMMTRNINEVFLAYNQNEGKLEYVSSNCQHVLGTPAEDWLNRQNQRLPVFREFFGTLEKDTKEKYYYIDKKLYNPKTGKYHPFRFRIYKITEDGIRWSIMVVTDETAEQEKNQMLQEALTAAEQGSRAKSEFLTSMSHDIRTPMNAIVGMAMIAASNLDNKKKVENCLRKVMLSSQHLLELINDVLDMSKIENGKIELKQDPMNLCLRLQELIEMFQSQTDSKQLHLYLDTEKIQHPYVMGDMLRFNQIFINLLSNALKFTHKGGSIRITAQELSCEKEDCGLYQICVEDNGIGMESEFLDRLFEPFERAERSTISKTEGSGLGLSIVKRLAELMNGAIQVESEPGRGSRFTICLPLHQIPLQEKTSSDEKYEDLADRSLKQRRVLLVEDNEMNMEIAKELLKMAGLSVEEAWNGTEALKKFTASPVYYYDMIITDIQMPQMDGYEEARAIRTGQRADALTIPIIAMTADASPKARQLAIEAGMNGYLTKPIDLSRLKELLKKHIKDNG